MANPHNPVTIVTGGGNLVTAVTDGGNPVTAVTDGGNPVTLTTSGHNPVTFIGGVSSELYPVGNAASIGSGEANDAGIWTANTNGAVTSDATPQDGSWAIKIDANGASSGINAGASFDLDGILTTGKDYTITFWARHVGVGGAFRIRMSQTEAGPDTDLIVALTTPANDAYASYSHPFTYGATVRYFSAREQNPTDDGGAYIDTISIVET